MQALGPGARFEDREVSIDDDDRVNGGVQNRPGRLTAFGQLRLGRERVREVTSDEDRLRRWCTGNAQRVTAGLHDHPVTIRVLCSVSKVHGLVRPPVEHALQRQFHVRAIVRMHQTKDASAHRDVVVVAEEVLTPRAVLGDHEVSIDDDDQVRGRGEDRLGHLNVRRQFLGVRVSGGDVSTGGVDQVAATLGRPFDPPIRAVTTTESILESRPGR